LEALTQQKISALQTKGDSYVSMQTTFATLETNLYALQADTSQLAISAGGAFDGLTATPSNTTTLSAAAGSAAIPGTYSLTVNSLAQANEVASQGFSDPNATLQQGTLSIQVGSGAPVTVTLNSQNNTLQGLATAINSAGGGVQAAVINDGSATPYRLMLTATSTGVANTISITNILTSGTGAAINPTQTTIQAATDAQITLGSGSGALTVNNASNTVNNLIPGVSLNLLQASPSQPVSLVVAPDTTTATTAVQNFVTSYNAVVDYITQNSSYNATTQTAGPLLGNQTSMNLQNDLSAAMNATVPGANGGLNSLASIGLTFNATGDLQLNTTTLSQAMSTQSGVAAVKNLFAMSGTSTNTGIQFVLGSTNTQPTAGTPYKVNITTPASQGAITGTTALANSITIGNTNNTFSLKVNGSSSGPISLTAGTYSPTQLAAMMQQEINASSNLNGNLVSVGVNSSNQLQITSQAYGSASQVSIGTGSAVGASGPLGFAGTESGAGVDVAGNFVVNGKTEAATGVGQLLSGDSGNANTDGLAVRATLSTPGTANLTVTSGAASQLNQILNSYLDPVTGQFATVNNGYQTQINNINTEIASDNTEVQTQTSSLTQQFAAMETAISKLKGIQSQLSSWATASAS
jgi:flagellar hook-associated protein 2